MLKFIKDKWKIEKCKYIVVGTASFLLFSLLCSPYIGLLVAFIIALSKEFFSYFSEEHTIESLDILFTMLIPVLLYEMWDFIF